MNEGARDILLVGGGHAHVAVLADWARRGLPVARATLLTPERSLRYSGMVPGWISGEHARDEGLVDLAWLARAAGVELVLDTCIAIDPVARSVLTRANGALPFTIASLDTGGVGRARRVLSDDPRLIDIRPIHRFVEALEQRVLAGTRIAVLGGGAGGVELAFALRNQSASNTPPAVTLIVGKRGLLPDFSDRVRRVVSRELARQGIATLAADARIEQGVLRAGPSEVPADHIIAALGSGAPDWPRAGGLACDERGFVAVDAQQRSLSHPHVLAAGDVAARQDRNVPHSGVHAVFAGPVLADNLRALANDRAPQRSYRPRWNHLYLMSAGTGEAIASYGPLAAQGKWVARLKAFIDKRWISKYAALAERA